MVSMRARPLFLVFVYAALCVTGPQPADARAAFRWVETPIPGGFSQQNRFDHPWWIPRRQDQADDRDQWSKWPTPNQPNKARKHLNWHGPGQFDQGQDDARSNDAPGGSSNDDDQPSLTVVPLPTSFQCLLSGLALLAYLTRTRRRRH